MPACGRLVFFTAHALSSTPGDVLLPLSSKIYFYVTDYGSEATEWRISLITYETVNENGYIIGTQYPYLDDDFVWNYTPDSYEDGNAVKSELVKHSRNILQEYLNSGKYSNKLKSFSSISIGWKIWSRRT